MHDTWQPQLYIHFLRTYFPYTVQIFEIEYQSSLMHELEQCVVVRTIA